MRSASMAYRSERARLIAAGVDTREMLRLFRRDEPDVRYFEQQLGDRPHRLFCGHPLDVVKAAEVDGPAVAPQGALAAIVEVIVEVAHGEFANGAVDRLAVAQAREI